MTFGEKLKIARIDAELKQSDLAKLVGTTNTTISNWEKGVSKPDIEMLSLICNSLHVTASYFLQSNLPEDEVSIKELNLIKKYRSLDERGRNMVDSILEEAYISRPKKMPGQITIFSDDGQITDEFSELFKVKAAHNDSSDPAEIKKMMQDLENLKRPE